MRKIEIEKYGRIDVDEVTLPTWDELNTNKSPIIDAWTRDAGSNMGYMIKLTMATDRESSTFTKRYPKDAYINGSKINRDGYIYPLFIIPELNAPIGNKVFVGNIVCTVISGGKALADSPVCRNLISVSEEFDWINGWDFKKSDIYKYLGSNEFWDEIDPESSSMKIAEEFADELGETSRLFDDPDDDRIIGISYNPESTSGGSFVFESYPYSIVFEAMRLFNKSDEDMFLDFIFDNRDNDRFADKDSDLFMEFANEWKDRTDYKNWSVDAFASYAMGHIGTDWESYINE